MQNDGLFRTIRAHSSTRIGSEWFIKKTTHKSPYTPFGGLFVQKMWRERAVNAPYNSPCWHLRGLVFEHQLLEVQDQSISWRRRDVSVTVGVVWILAREPRTGNHNLGLLSGELHWSIAVWGPAVFQGLWNHICTLIFKFKTCEIRKNFLIVRPSR